MLLRRHLLGTVRPLTSHPVSDLSYDVIVVGGGHAGTEAACAAARTGVNTLLVTHKKETIGEMSCNPSFGGIGKGHLLREIDALDGVSPRICDRAGIHFKVLNRKKGPAVWGLRAQIDRQLYKTHLQEEVFNTPNLTVIASPVEDLLISECQSLTEDSPKLKCHGIVTDSGEEIKGDVVILTTGTFLRGCINVGLDKTPAGRIGDEPAIGLAKTIEKIGFNMGRLKTGTPPRLNKSSIDFDRLTNSKGDKFPLPFSFMNEDVWIKPEDQIDCHLTLTNKNVDDLIFRTMHLNPHIKEEINGPRYCPSIESKVMRFKGRQHQVWLEPEGLDSDVIYPNGLSCTMPVEYQLEMLRYITGLENCEIVRPGYGVEYDFIDPKQLSVTLETLKVKDLFFAGQINGTTGYEEAAAQGVIAGVNAALKVQGHEPLVISRTEGYIGVLIDDLTTQGTNEPYRMFTSRAEFRLALRPDNADARLTEKSFTAGCVREARFQKSHGTQTALKENIDLMKSVKYPTAKWRRDLKLPAQKSSTLVSAFHLLSVTEGVTMEMLINTYPEFFGHLKTQSNLQTRLEIEAKYSSELESQLEEIKEVRRDESLIIPSNLDYLSLPISTEAKIKLTESQPHTIAAASRIPGLTPVTLVALLRHIKYKTTCTSTS